MRGPAQLVQLATVKRKVLSKMTTENRLIVMILLAVLAIPTASAHVTLYIVPQDSCVPQGYGNTTYIEIWADVTGSDTLRGGQFSINTDGTCVDIISLNSWGPKIYPPGSRWKHEGSGHPCGDCEYDWIAYEFYDGPPTYNGYLTAPANEMICNLTVHCNCSSCDYCTSGTNITCGMLGCLECPIQVLDKDINNLYPDDATLIDGTVECGTSSSAESFSKPLYEGWNLLSLPLNPEDNAASAVLSTVSYNAIYRYNAESKQFENIESTDAMNPGTGYFVHVTGDCTWNYRGYAYNSMNVSLEPGLNMVGWMNCSKEDIDDALSSISGDYRYVARWNTSAQKFEVYNPKAPSGFNDVTTIDRGTGYFISAKQDCTLCETC